MYNVLEKLRTGVELDEEDRRTHEQGLIAVLRDIHDELDATVLEAYGWPANITTEDILFRLVELNTARQAEERRGKIRWLRPEFQQLPQPGQAGLGIEMEESVATVTARRPWPPTLPERVRAIRGVLSDEQQPLNSVELSRVFARARRTDVQAILDTLVSLNQARTVEDRYTV